MKDKIQGHYDSQKRTELCHMLPLKSNRIPHKGSPMAASQLTLSDLTTTTTIATTTTAAAAAAAAATTTTAAVAVHNK